MMLVLKTKGRLIRSCCRPSPAISVWPHSPSWSPPVFEPSIPSFCQHGSDNLFRFLLLLLSICPFTVFPLAAFETWIWVWKLEKLNLKKNWTWKKNFANRTMATLRWSWAASSCSGPEMKLESCWIVNVQLDAICPCFSLGFIRALVWTWVNLWW